MYKLYSNKTLIFVSVKGIFRFCFECFQAAVPLSINDLHDILKHTTVKELNQGKDRVTVVLDQLKDLGKAYKYKESEMIKNLIKDLPGTDETCIMEKSSKLLQESNSCSDLTNDTTNVELLIENGKALIENMYETIEDILGYLTHCSEKPYYKRYTCYLKQLNYILNQTVYYSNKILALTKNAEKLMTIIIGDLEDCLFHKKQLLKKHIEFVEQSCKNKL